MADEKNLVPEDNQGDIVIYQTEDGGTKIDVRFEGETVWLTQQQMAELFGSSRTNIVEHIRHIYEEGELDEDSTCRKFRQVQTYPQRRKQPCKDRLYICCTRASHRHCKARI